MNNNIKRGIETRNKILDFISGYIKEHQYPPSIREIGEGVGLKSTSTVHAQLKIMLDEGMIESDGEAGRTRAIRVPGYKFVEVRNE